MKKKYVSPKCSKVVVSEFELRTYDDYFDLYIILPDGNEMRVPGELKRKRGMDWWEFK